ncbi:hypothetical protein PIB30_028903 [Stylosanthes scabra]|uniref:Uncharacterized protein n=1 Tax=Stylosanthes scabra TaxID=79078 RepID=A0ABU6Z8S5_9FABA|nr:hypothetical protein [Stylosanthes scabra]
MIGIQPRTPCSGSFLTSGNVADKHTTTTTYSASTARWFQKFRTRRTTEAALMHLASTGGDDWFRVVGERPSRGSGDDASLLQLTATTRPGLDAKDGNQAGASATMKPKARCNGAYRKRCWLRWEGVWETGRGHGSEFG